MRRWEVILLCRRTNLKPEIDAEGDDQGHADEDGAVDVVKLISTSFSNQATALRVDPPAPSLLRSAESSLR